MKRFLLGFAVAAMLPGLTFARDKRARDEPPQALLSFVVLKDSNGKPVRNAAVVIHGVNSHDKQERGGLELKTDAEGKASYDGMPYGKVRVQVLAPGMQTFGEDYDVEEATVQITVRLKRPTGQYSIYEEHPEDKKPDTSSPPAPDPKAKSE